MSKKKLSAKQLAALAKGRRKLAAMRKKSKKVRGKRRYVGPILPEDTPSRNTGKRKAKARSTRARIRRGVKAFGKVFASVVTFVPSTLKRWF